MAKKWLGKIKEGKITHEDYVQGSFNDWAKANEGAGVEIIPTKKPVSEDLRGYYFGAVIPVIRSTCDEWEKLEGEQIHEIVKKMLFYFETWNPKTKRVERFGRSVMKNDDFNNTAKAMNFLEIIRQYLADCGLEMPDSEDYKRALDKAELL
jgi:hypothetical protein